MRIIISGALGHMGREVALAAKSKGIEIACGVDIASTKQDLGFPVVNKFSDIVQEADALIDFSTTSSLQPLLEYITANHVAAVLCVTGYTDEQLTMIDQACEKVPILRSANMSLGIHVIERLAKMAAHALGDDYDIEIVEKHHRRKLDSPSGTALMLADAIKDGRANVKETFGRHGRSDVREKNEIGIHAIRGGTVSGEHEIGFYGEAEEIFISHRAENRALFARGALRAAEFLEGQKPGMYSMKDVVKLAFEQ